MNKFKNKKGSIDFDIVVFVAVTLCIIGVIGFGIFKFVYSRTAGNKTVVDLKYKFDKAIINIAGEKIEVDIDTWSDYEGEQIQIIGKDGKVYLVSSFNTILIKE